MNLRMTYWWTLVLVLCASSSCRSGAQDSSSSHFVGCTLDRECLDRVDARGCDGSFCVDETGARIDSDGVGVIGGDAPEPRCNPTLPLERPVELGDVAVVAEAEDGTHYVVGREQGEYTVFRSEGTALIPFEVTDSISGDEEVFLTINAPLGGLTIWFAPGDTPTQAMLFDGFVDDPSDAPPGEELTLRDERVLDDFEVRAAISEMSVQYNAISLQGHEVVVVRPDRYLEYESFRLFLATPDEETLVERQITEVLRAQDGGSTHVRFLADGAESDAFFPIDEAEGALLTIGNEEVPLIHGFGQLPGFQSLDFECFAAPPNGWRETVPREALADGGAPEPKPETLGPLCDGSADVRLLVRSVAGFGTDLDFFFGDTSLLIDGGCRYWFNGANGEWRTGELSAAEAAEYEEAVNWNQLLELDRIRIDTGCVDGGTSYIQTRATLSSCTCSCDGAPEALQEAMDEAFGLREGSYAKRSVPIDDGALRALAVVDFFRDDTDPLVEWPLARDVADLVSDSVGPTSSGTALTDADDIRTLRTLRADYYESAPDGADYIGVQTEAGDIYGLLLKDELRSPLAEQMAEIIEAGN